MHVFTEDSILDYIDYLRSGGRIVTDDQPLNLLSNFYSMTQHQVFVHRSDAKNAKLIVLGSDAIGRLGGDERTLERALQRVHRTACAFRDPPVSLPQSWRKFQSGNRLAFFALARSMVDVPLRWIAENLDNGDVVFWRLTSPGDEVDLGAYSPDLNLISGIREAYEEAWARTEHGTETDEAPRLRPLIELVGPTAVSRNLSYDEWMDRLDHDQLFVVNYHEPQTLKVRGGAGAGKTLTLQIKALDEAYRAYEEGEDCRVLYLTHSWALAEVVDHSLRQIDRRGLADLIDVCPIMLLRDSLHGDLPEGVEILGSDSLEGKKQQLSLIGSIIRQIGDGDWHTFEDGVSEFVRSGVTGRSNESAVVLAWMLMREFTEVMDAYRIKPSREGRQKYLDIQRADWMVDLPSDTDKSFFYSVFRMFVDRLRDEGQMTTDQAYDDFHRYLESYAWNIRRATEGYDIILVDEFHLFSDSERYLLRFLTRDPSRPPRLILALDPRQSPFMLLTGMEDNVLSRRSEPNRWTSTSVELSLFHRFAPAVHRFISLVHKTYPAILEEGDDWTFDLKAPSAKDGSAEQGAKISFCGEGVQAAELGVVISKKTRDQIEKGDRVALIAAGSEEMDVLLPILNNEKDSVFTVLDSRDDIAQLQYVKRTIVVATAADCAGLQFSHVVVLVFSGREVYHGRGLSAHRAAITELYVAASRAERFLHIVATQGEGPVAELLEKAVTDSIVTDDS